MSAARRICPRHAHRAHRRALPQGKDHLPARVYGCRHAARHRAPWRHDRYDPPDEQIGEMRFDMPLAELILDFFDQLKSRTKVTPRSTTSSTNIAPPSSSSSISCFRATRWTRCRLSCTRIRLMAWPAACATSSRRSSATAVRGAYPGRHRQQDHRPLHR